MQPVSDNAPLPKPGDVIDGKYRIDHRIGSGAMSVVYQATHRVTQKRFAVKWLLPELATKGDFAERFMREARVGGRFEHPNVVEVYDVGASTGGFYIVLELLSGESLQQRITRRELSWRDTCRLLLPCMRAVAEAHGSGIVHRDLKPANIFVCAATKKAPEIAKVLDFGLAKLARGPGEQSLLGTRSGVVMGTPNYMPLEQMRGEAVDRRADVFAFGVTLYQALSGRLPFQAATFGDLVLAMASEAPSPLERWAPRLPSGVGAVVQRALGRHPEDRYSDLDAFLEALAPFVPPSLAEEPEPIVAVNVVASLAPEQPVAAPKPSPPAANRSSWLLPTLIGSALLASAGVLGLLSAEISRMAAKPAQAAPIPAPPAPCEPAVHAEVELQPKSIDIGPLVPEPQYEGWTLPGGGSYDVRTARPTDFSREREPVDPAPVRLPRARVPQSSMGNSASEVRRQGRQARSYIATAPPPDPRAEEPSTHLSTPPANEEHPRPPRWLPLRTDDF